MADATYVEPHTRKTGEKEVTVRGHIRKIPDSGEAAAKPHVRDF